jgi:hydroxyacyl-ACP dehydratase HTD2-like protein with hotdog domain
VTASDIRRWAMAVYWPEPPPARFVDEAAAVRSRFGELVAPQELNPFAWMPGKQEAASEREPPPEGVRRLFGGCHIEYHEPIRVGDVVRRRTRLEGWRSKAARSGELLLVDWAHEWRNQRDGLVRHAVYTLLHQAVPDGAI